MKKLVLILICLPFLGCVSNRNFIKYQVDVERRVKQIENHNRWYCAYLTGKITEDQYKSLLAAELTLKEMREILEKEKTK